MKVNADCDEITFESGNTVYAHGGALWPQLNDLGASFSYGSDGGVDLSQLKRADVGEVIADALTKLIEFVAFVVALPDEAFLSDEPNKPSAAEEMKASPPEPKFAVEMSPDEWAQLVERGR